MAQGPHGESAEMGITFLAGDTNNPRVQQLLRTLRNGGLRNTAYAQGTYYPYGADQAKTFEDLLQGVRRKAGLQPAAYQIASATPMPTNSAMHCTHLTGTVDFRDGKGQRELNAVYCANPPGPAGNWMSFAYMTTVPMQLLRGAERNTLGAMMQSFQVDQRRVRRTRECRHGGSRPSIKRRMVGQMVTNRIDAAHKAEDIQRAGVEVALGCDGQAAARSSKTISSATLSSQTHRIQRMEPCGRTMRRGSCRAIPIASSM